MDLFFEFIRTKNYIFLLYLIMLSAFIFIFKQLSNIHEKTIHEKQNLRLECIEKYSSCFYNISEYLNGSINLSQLNSCISSIIMYCDLELLDTIYLWIEKKDKSDLLKIKDLLKSSIKNVKSEYTLYYKNISESSSTIERLQIWYKNNLCYILPPLVNTLSALLFFGFCSTLSTPLFYKTGNDFVIYLLQLISLIIFIVNCIFIFDYFSKFNNVHKVVSLIFFTFILISFIFRCSYSKYIFLIDNFIYFLLPKIFYKKTS